MSSVSTDCNDDFNWLIKKKYFYFSLKSIFVCLFVCRFYGIKSISMLWHLLNCYSSQQENSFDHDVDEVSLIEAQKVIFCEISRIFTHFSRFLG